MGTPNMIDLKFYGRREEARCSEALKPGHLLEFHGSTGTVRKNTRVGASNGLAVALIDPYQGKTTTDAYTSGDPVFIGIPISGDVMLLRLPAGAPAVSAMDMLQVGGDGTVSKATYTGSDLLYQNAASSAEVENTTVETAFDVSYTIAANTLRVGDVIRITAQATVNDNNSTDTLTLKLKIGSTIIVATAAVDVADGDVGLIVADLVIRSIGASGTFVASGTQALGVPGTVTAKPFFKGSTTVDTTAAQAITVTATWSVAHADNEVELTNLTVELMRGAQEGAPFQAEEAVNNSAGVAETFIRARMV